MVDQDDAIVSDGWDVEAPEGCEPRVGFGRIDGGVAGEEKENDLRGGGLAPEAETVPQSLQGRSDEAERMGHLASRRPEHLEGTERPEPANQRPNGQLQRSSQRATCQNSTKCSNADLWKQLYHEIAKRRNVIVLYAPSHPGAMELAKLALK
jgi:hypothetical protein